MNKEVEKKGGDKGKEEEQIISIAWTEIKYK
jgi:hypothetical protein